MKQLFFSLLATFCIISTSFAQAQDKPDEIFSKYFAATGGKELFDNVTTYTVKQSLKNGTSSDYDVAINASPAEQSLNKTKTILKRDFIYGVTATDGWVKIPLGSSDKNVKYDTKDLGETDKVTLRRESKDLLLPFLNYQSKGYIASYVGAEAVNATAFSNHVELTGQDIKYDLYFDSATGLLTMEKATLSSGDIITKTYTKYAQSAYGISYPSEGTIYSTADKKNFKTTTTMSFNDKLDISAFKR